MRYLKVFNEDIVDGDLREPEYITKNNELKQNVSDLFLQYSTYLMDNGLDYDVRITGSDDRLYLQIAIFKPNPNVRNDLRNPKLEIRWGDVKEDIIQICHLLSNEYKFERVRLIERELGHIFGEDRRGSNEYSYKIQTILNDEIKDDKLYEYIILEMEAFSRPSFKKKGLVDKFKDIFKKK